MHYRFIRSVLFLSLAFSLSIAHGFEPDSASVSFERLGPFGGDVRALLIDSNNPDTYYLGSSNGKMYKSVDSGRSWILLQPGIGKNGYVVDTLVQHPTDPDHIYAGAWDLHSDGGGLFESLDAGRSWSAVLLPQAVSAVRGFAVSGSDPESMIVGTLTGVFVSDDGGKNWKQVGGATLHRAESVAMDPSDPRILYVGTWRLGYKSVDFGNNWKLVKKGMPLDSDIFSLAVNPRNPEVVYAGACSGAYRSSDRAASWIRLKVRGNQYTIRSHIILVDPIAPSRVYAGTTEGLYVSNNEGKSWKRLTADDISVNAIQVNLLDNRRILIGTEYRGVLRSEDAGRTWDESNTGFVHRKISWIIADPSDKGRLIGGVLSGEGGLYSYNREIGSWETSGIKNGTRVFSFLVLPGEKGQLAGTSQGIYWQHTRSGTWDKLPGLIADRTIYSLAMDVSGGVVYAGTDRGIYRTSIETLNFKLPSNSRISPKVWCLLSPASDPGLVYAGTSIGLLRSWDRGTTWHVLSVSGLPDRVAIRTLAVDPSDKERLMAGTSVGLYESVNGGIHWKRAGNGHMGVDIAAVLFMDDSGKTVLAADKVSGGVFYSTDGGLSWDKFFSPLFDSPVNCLLKDPEHPNRVFMGTQSDGVYSLQFK